MVVTYQLSQRYVYLEGNAVRMYFIQGLPYTFDELPKVSKRCLNTDRGATDKDYDMEDSIKCLPI